MAEAVAGAEIAIAERGYAGIVTLNRPAVLNVLNHAMVIEFDQALARWQSDPRIRVVIVRGAGERAFCAGGDVRALYEAGPASDFARGFYRAEYRLNRRIFWYEKPIVALVEGIVMGGGVGVSLHAQRRIVGERVTFAMPEASIGFFPDVGATWILPQLPGRSGLYLGLTGARLGAADMVQLGLAQAVVPFARFDALAERLAERGPSNGTTIDDLIADFVVDPGRAPIAEHMPAIKEAFAVMRPQDALSNLAALEGAWARAAEAAMAAASPTSLFVTLRQLDEGRDLAFDEAMRLEYRLSQRFMRAPDFFEGVRARVIDKDNRPRWNPPNLDAVDPAAIDAYFADLGPDELTFPDRRRS